MIDPIHAMTILLMPTVTYLTRIGGYLVLKDLVITGRMKAVMECAPGCVLITIIAPVFVSGRISDLLVLGVTIIAATRLQIFPTVVVAIVSAGVMRAFGV